MTTSELSIGLGNFLLLDGGNIVTGAVIVMAGLIVVGLLWMMAPKRCPSCRAAMKELDPFKSGKTHKYKCTRCGKVVDSGIPSGRGKR